MPGAMEKKIGRPMRACFPLLMPHRGVKKLTSGLTDWPRVKNRSAKGFGKKKGQSRHYSVLFLRLPTMPLFSWGNLLKPWLLEARQKRCTHIREALAICIEYNISARIK
jgi:hypothetical protein